MNRASQGVAKGGRSTWKEAVAGEPLPRSGLVQRPLSIIEICRGRGPHSPDKERWSGNVGMASLASGRGLSSKLDGLALFSAPLRAIRSISSTCNASCKEVSRHYPMFRHRSATPAGVTGNGGVRSLGDNVTSIQRIGRGRASRHGDCQHHGGRGPAVRVGSTQVKC